MNPETTEGVLTVMLGRERELADLNHGVEDALSGRGRLFLVSGEAGIGKSRLIEEITATARDRGMLVLSGRCWEAVDAPSYWPWIQALRELEASLSNDQLRALAGPRANALSSLMPELAGQADSHSHTETNGSINRFRLFDSVAGLLKSAAASQPLMLVLEDLHAADEPSLLLLQLIARDHRNSPILVVGSYEESQCRGKPAHARLLSEIARDGKRITLRGLDEASVTKLYEVLAGEKPSDALADAVFRATEGNPLFVDETVRMLAAKQELHRSDYSLGYRVPEGVRDVIRYRLDALPSDVAELLSIASVIGREFDLTLLKRISDVDMDRLLDLLAQAASAGIVVETSALGRYAFTHILIRETLYEGVTAGNRMRLHRRVAEVLEEVYATDLTARLPELAHHWFKAAQAGDAEKTMHYSVQAAEGAMNQLAYEEAARLYQRALKVSEVAQPGKETIDALQDALEKAESRSADNVDQSDIPTRGSFTREGDYYSIEYAGKTVRIRNVKGLRYVAYLLKTPGREIHALDLVMTMEGASSTSGALGIGQEGLTAPAFGDAGEVLDAKARAQYKQRLVDLQEELEEAQSFNDPERAAAAQREIDALAHEIAVGVGLGGRGRKAVSHVERARVNATKALKDALKRIAENHPALGDHLRTTLHTGTYCSYSPDPRLPITWEVS